MIEKVFCAGTLGVPDSVNEIMHVEKTKEYFYSQEFQNRLKKGQVRGTLTHLRRPGFNNDEINTQGLTYEDYTLANDKIANICKDLYIDDQNNIIVTLIIPDTEQGKEVQAMMEAGSEFGLSICSLTPNDTTFSSSRVWYPCKVMGFDFTDTPCYDNAWEVK